MEYANRCFRLRLGLIALIAIAMAACNAPESGTSLRQPGSMLEPATDDRAITAAVKVALRADSSLAGGAIEVTSSDGAIELSGAADEQAQIDRAMALAFVVPGVRSIKNRVRLADPPLAGATHADDRRITTRVMADMRDNALIRQFSILVVTVRGEVLLSGRVDQQTRIDNAVKVARAVDGVRDVRHVMHIRQ